LNTLLLLLIGAVMSWGVKKIDESNTQLIRLSTAQSFMGEEVNKLRTEMKDMVLKADFQAEVSRLTRELETARADGRGEREEGRGTRSEGNKVQSPKPRVRSPKSE
jgi:hypothetical protein